MMIVVGYIILISVVIAIYMQIPPEDPETIEARKRHGKAK